MASPQDDILRLLALGNTGGPTDQFSPGTSTTSLSPTSSLPEEPGFLDTLKGFLPDSIQDAGLGTLAGFAAAPFLGPAGAILFGGGLNQSLGLDRKKREAAEASRGTLTPGTGASLGLDDKELDILRSLPNDKRNAALQTLLARKKGAPGAGNKVVGNFLLDSTGNILFKAPKKFTAKPIKATLPDGTTEFGDFNDKKFIQRINASGGNINLVGAEDTNLYRVLDKEGNSSGTFKGSELDLPTINASGASIFGIPKAVAKGKSPKVRILANPAGGSEAVEINNLERIQELLDKGFTFKPATLDVELQAPFTNITEIGPDGFPVGEPRAMTKSEFQKARRKAPPGTTYEMANIDQKLAKTKRREDAKTDYKTRIRQIDDLSNISSDILKILQTDPGSATFAGDIATAASNILAGIASFFPDKNIRGPITETQESKILAFAKNNAQLRSATLDLAYASSALRGQVGRGLSDKDVEFAIKIIGGKGDPSIIANTLGAFLDRQAKTTRRLPKIGKFNSDPEDDLVIKKLEKQSRDFINRANFGKSKIVRFGRDPETGRPVRLN